MQSKSEIQLPSVNKDSEEAFTENNQHSETEMEYHETSKSSEYESQNASNIHTFEKMEKKKIQSYPSTSETKKTIHDYEISFMINAINKLQGLSNLTSQTIANKDDTFDYFGKYVASILRNLGQPKAMKLQQDITNIIANVLCPPECFIDDNSKSAASEKEYKSKQLFSYYQ